MNKILITLVILLILSISPVNAYPIFPGSYEIVSHDVTVKQGKTATIEAELCKFVTYPPYSFEWVGLGGALLCFTVKDKYGQVLAEKTAKTDDSWWIRWPSAICAFNTADMPIGNHILTIRCSEPEENVVQVVTRDYRFNVI